jgi:hypothetical protein
VQSTGYKGMRISLAQTIWMHGYCILLNPNAITSNTGYKGVQSNAKTSGTLHALISGV